MNQLPRMVWGLDGAASRKGPDTEAGAGRGPGGQTGTLGPSTPPWEAETMNKRSLALGK